MNELTVGSTLYYRDINRRRYDENKHIIYREHFRPVEIIGETSRSWIVRNPAEGDKPVNKKQLAADGYYRAYFASLDEVEKDCWLNDHRYKIVRLVGSCNDYDKLRSIAEIVGYKAAGDGDN